jgi:alkanesulfonate monooxygenase SsuD/methylene tetrahydromethanopterin reductase-like flavin-dependent oxidoreductase (luciferase family)
MTDTSRPRFGIATAPMQVDYQDIVRVWREADAIGQIEHAWLFDHLMPIGGDPDGTIFEGWTLLAAMAAQTRRLRLGLLVTSNRFRPPAMLAKIATTVDVVSGGRLDFGIGVGSRPGHPLARREYAAHGLPFHDTADAVGSLAEACTVIRRLWTEEAPFDFHGAYVDLTGAFGNPKPVQRPHPPILIGGRSAATLRVVAEHADLWNIPGGDIADAAGPLLHRDRPRPRRDHPLDPPVGLLRPAGQDPRRDRRGDRRRLPAHRPRTAGALPRRRRTLGRRRTHRHGEARSTRPPRIDHPIHPCAERNRIEHPIIGLALDWAARNVMWEIPEGLAAQLDTLVG